MTVWRTSKAGKREPNGSLAVTLQDQTTPTVIAYFSVLEQSTTTTGTVAIDDYVFPLTSVTGVTGGKYLSVFDPTSVRFSIFFVVSVTDLNVTVDRPIDFAYPSGSYVDISEVDLAQDGDPTPIVAGLRNNAGAEPPPGIALTMDVTRIMFFCLAAGACDLATFANITALTNGITVRKRDGEYHNIMNAKSNGELGSIMYDFTIHDADTPVQGQDGFLGRLTFGGQSKMGVVQRIAINEDLEVIIADDIAAVTTLHIIAEGSIVQP